MDNFSPDPSDHDPLPQEDIAAEVAFKGAMRHLASGVSIVAAQLGSERAGLTATSVTSLSADPPSLIVCVKQTASGLPLLRRALRFSVNVLGHDHSSVADRFAGRDGSAGADRFRDADWIAPPSGVPVLAGALASFECRAEEIIDRYSHAIIIGRVLRARSASSGDALLYWRGAYARLPAA